MDSKFFHILLVEDNAADVYLFEKALENAQLRFELTVIRDGAEALAFVRREGQYANSAAPDLAVLDLNLPKNGGLQVLRAIRESNDLARMPVAVVSSSASPQDLAKTHSLGVERHFTKPPDLEAFLQIGQIFKDMLLAHKPHS
jgi:two-component system, chemotaxis family, response regulator Rcp1